MSHVAPNQPRPPSSFIPEMGLDYTLIDDYVKSCTEYSYSEGDSFTPNMFNKMMRRYTATVIWGPKSTEVDDIKRNCNSVQGIYGSNCNDLNEVILRCKEIVYGLIPLNSTNPDAPASLNNCELEFNGRASRTENIGQIFTKGNEFNHQKGLINILEMLTLKPGERVGALHHIANSGKNFKDYLKVSNLKKLTGTFHDAYQVRSTKVNSNIFDFFFPESATPTNDTCVFNAAVVTASPTDYTKKSAKFILEGCTKQDIKTHLDFYYKLNGTARLIGSKTSVDEWTQVFNKMGFNNPEASVDGTKVTIDTSKSSLNFSSPEWPSSEFFYLNALIPAGLGISYIGAKYAKNNYENTDKSQIRRTVGCVVGLATAIFGVAVATTPFAYNQYRS